jgi:Zn-dependent M28 family amino/carboxypeptidase
MSGATSRITASSLAKFRGIMRKSFLVALTIAFAAASLLAQSVPKRPPKSPHIQVVKLPVAAIAAMQSIKPQRIREHVRLLSHDLLEGRGTGQRGGDIAAQYLATQFALDGLTPAFGDSYFQKVPMVGITTTPATTIELEPEHGKLRPLRLGEDVVAIDEAQNATDDIDAPIVFVGYGITAPEYRWDDYKGADVRGKVLLMLVNEPPSADANFFKGEALTYYGRWTYKFEEAAREGAVGAILIHKTDMASYGWNVVRSSWDRENDFLREDGAPKLKLAGWAQLEIARKLLADSDQDLDSLLKRAQSRDFKPITLSVRLKAHLVSKIRPLESQNVVAILPGSDPGLKKQAVIYSAHYDHLGIHAEQGGDNIYNGALDNATGCGILLEIAHAFASSAQRPRRSIIFASVTAEEQGLIGSEYLGKHPPIRAGNVSLGLNFDDLPPYGLPEGISVTGAERTRFYPVVQATAREFGFAIDPDANPSAGYYYRSDHFSFARVGIPAFSVKEGMKYKGHPLQWGIARENDFRKSRYHQPSDEFDPTWDFSGLGEMARFGFELGWKAAMQPQIVSWQKGDEFEPARLASEEASTTPSK